MKHETNKINLKSCFSETLANDVPCNRKTCKNWIKFKEGHNCVFLAAKKGPLTLQKIGEIYSLTRMRICQLEKEIFEKVRQRIM